jgi:hypothetical protein
MKNVANGVQERPNVTSTVELAMVMPGFRHMSRQAQLRSSPTAHHGRSTQWGSPAGMRAMRRPRAGTRRAAGGAAARTSPRREAEGAPEGRRLIAQARWALAPGRAPRAGPDLPVSEGPLILKPARRARGHGPARLPAVFPVCAHAHTHARTLARPRGRCVPWPKPPLAPRPERPSP